MGWCTLAGPAWERTPWLSLSYSCSALSSTASTTPVSRFASRAAVTVSGAGPLASRARNNILVERTCCSSVTSATQSSTCKDVLRVRGRRAQAVALRSDGWWRTEAGAASPSPHGAAQAVNVFRSARAAKQSSRGHQFQLFQSMSVLGDGLGRARYAVGRGVAQLTLDLSAGNKETAHHERRQHRWKSKHSCTRRDRPGLRIRGSRRTRRG
jgi:hypothetical protein